MAVMVTLGNGPLGEAMLKNMAALQENLSALQAHARMLAHANAASSTDAQTLFSVTKGYADFNGRMAKLAFNTCTWTEFRELLDTTAPDPAAV